MPHDIDDISESAELCLLTGPLRDVEQSDGASPWRVVSITGEEAISELYSFVFVVLAEDPVLPLAVESGGFQAALLKQQVSFRLGPGGDLRYGVIAEARNEGPFTLDDRRLVRLRLRVVPRAFTLTQRRNSRIFQRAYLHEIVSTVLAESGVAHRWDLRNIYPRRIYCTQYEETDYDFVRRLFAEEGILYFFEHAHEVADAPKEEKDHGLSDMEHVQRAFKVAKAATKEVAGILKKTGDEDLKGIAGIAVGGLGATADLARQNVDEEDDAPMEIPPGRGGPRDVGDVLVFVDRAAGYAMSSSAAGERPLALALRDEAGLRGDAEQIRELAPGWSTAPEHVEIIDYDFRRPLLELKARRGQALERERQPGLPFEIYDHHGEYITHDVGDEAAEIHLEQHRREAAVAEGRGRCPRLAAGHSFALTVLAPGAREAYVDDGSYAVVGIHHEYYNPDFGRGDAGEVEGIVRGCASAIREALVSGRELPEEDLRKLIREGVSADALDAGWSYRNRFRVVAGGLAYRPPRPARTLRHVTESATVVGPVGKDIYLDRYGRVKVQFHWDRQGEFDAHSSCWLRVVQPWAGAGYGFQFFPRVGMEVLVTFLGGDTDRPVVIGSLYNGTHATPEPLPERLTRSGIRTQTSPHGGGFNELSFEDASDAQRVYLHAERNFDAEVNHDHDLAVGNRHRVSVGGHQDVGVAGSQRTAVGGDHATAVGGNQGTYVGGNASARVVGSRMATTEGHDLSRVGGASCRRIDRFQVTQARGAIDTSSVSLYGNAQWIGGSASLGASVTAGKLIVLRTESSEDARIRFECGTSVIELHPDRIAIEADEISIRGRNKSVVRGGDSKLTLTDRASLSGKKGAKLHNETGGAGMGCNDSDVSMVWGAEVNIHGPQVNFQPRLRPGPSNPAGPDQEQDEPPNVTLRFTHLRADDDTALANTPYRLTFLSGAGQRAIEGTTDGDGKIEVYVPEEAKTVFVTLMAHESYPDVYPEERGELHFGVKLLDEAPSEEAKQTFHRLVNLGYRPSSDAESPETATAIREFQTDRDLPRTGELDDTTRDKLREVYGS